TIRRASFEASRLKRRMSDTLVHVGWLRRCHRGGLHCTPGARVVAAQLRPGRPPRRRAYNRGMPGEDRAGAEGLGGQSDTVVRDAGQAILATPATYPSGNPP